jgi:hypothetical protein
MGADTGAAAAAIPISRSCPDASGRISAFPIGDSYRIGIAASLLQPLL